MNQDSLKVVGQNVLRRDGMSHVTGQTQYIDDIRFPGMLHLKMVRSPLHHARIRGIDFSEAEKVPGFVRALTYKDVPKNLYTILCLIGIGPDEEPVLAEDIVRFKGEQIAAIIAESEEAAYEAVARVKLDLEELPAVFDVEEALQPGAPILKPWGKNYFEYEGHHCRRVRYGDVEEGFAEADFIVEGKYEPKPIEHAPLETTGCVAKVEADGRITVYTNTQALYFSMDNTALILQVPFNKLHFVGGTVGGGFGGKVDVIVEPIAALAALKTGRPVKYLYTREEEFHISSTRVPWRIYFKDGVTKDGRIVARQVISYADSGAYNRHTPYAVTKHAANIAGPYTIPNVKIDAHCVYTNRVPTSAMRGFGVTSASFATEVQMDKIARVVGMDPFEIRILNGYRNGDTRPYQKVVGDATLIEVIKGAADMIGHPLSEPYAQMHSWDRDTSPEPLQPVGAPQPRNQVSASQTRNQVSGRNLVSMVRGAGISSVNYPTGMNLGGDPTQALIHMTTTGSFVISLASTDLGQGLKTVLAQIGAEALGVPVENVLIDTGDTDTGPHCMGTFASRTTHRAGNAIIMAATEAKKTLLEIAADELEARPDDLETDGQGFIRVKGSPDRKIDLVSAALAGHFKYGKTVAGRGIFFKPNQGVDPETGKMDPDSTEAHACVVAEVEVDPETGDVKVLSLRSVYEIGRQVNPALVQGQIKGGSVMGLGHALYESTEPYYPSPEHRPGGFFEYVLPLAPDVPEMEIQVLEYPSVDGPYGVKGFGEMTANAPIPAIVNAINNALGTDISCHPVTPEVVLAALAAKQAA